MHSEHNTETVNDDARAQQRVCFVIPTYNEAANITALLNKLTTLYPQPHFAFLIVDDESPDGTAKLVREFVAGDGAGDRHGDGASDRHSNSDTRVHLLEGQRRGLGDAYVRGISHALDTLNADIVIQMDADFSHDPADAQKLIAHIHAGADVAIGSRYVAGGAVDERWSPYRRALSRWGNRLARWIAGLSTVRDCTAGYKAITATALRAANIQRIRVQGYAFQIVLLHHLLRTSARVVEEPVYFREREHGQTKLGIRDLVEFFYHVWWLRFSRHQTFIKFAVTGASGVLINLGSFLFLLDFGLHKLIASPLAIQLSIVWNFLLNNYWTFAERELVGRKRIRGLKFNLVSLGTLTLSYATFIALSMLLPDSRPVFLQACSIIPAAVLNYFINSHWTFRDSSVGGKV